MNENNLIDAQKNYAKMLNLNEEKLKVEISQLRVNGRKEDKEREEIFLESGKIL